MSSIVWENIPLAVMFVLAIVGVPLWITFRHPDNAPDFSGAHAYLAAKATRGRHAPFVPAAVASQTVASGSGSARRACAKEAA